MIDVDSAENKRSLHAPVDRPSPIHWLGRDDRSEEQRLKARLLCGCSGTAEAVP